MFKIQKIIRKVAYPVLLIGAGLFSSPACAQEASPQDLLPGGASTLTETHGDWTVRCQIVSSNKVPERACVTGQRQTNTQGQQVVAIELVPSDDGFAGTFVLPFGLAVTQGVSFAVDKGSAITTAFSTCVPTGCLVPFKVERNTREAMRSGTSMTITASTIDGSPLELSVSLTGLSAATTRIVELMK